MILPAIHQDRRSQAEKSVMPACHNRKMPYIRVENPRAYYRLEGREDLPVLVLSHSLGCDHSMWDPQMPALLDHFRVMRYDTRGHGASDAPEGDYTLERLGRDVLAIADALSIDKFAFCGLSLGGMVGQWIAVNAPGRITKLVLANTSSKFPDPSIMETRRKAVLEQGIKAVEEAVLGRFFSAETLSGPNVSVGSIRYTLNATDPVGYAGCCAVVRDLDMRDQLSKIDVPTLIISSETDQSTPYAGHGDVLANGIAGAKVVLLPTAHLSNLELPRSFTWHVLDFLCRNEGTTAEAGMSRRKSVLGEEYVERAMANVTDFNRDFQDLLNTYCWGAIWTRPGLDTRTRRLLVLAITASLGRWEEFRLHLRAGLDHKLELVDVKEMLMHTAIYAGVPASNTGFKIAKEEIGAKPNA